jgi:hypothetical protein
VIPGERLEDLIRKIPAEFENHLCQSPATRNAQSFLTHRTRKHCCRAALAIVADVVSDSADNDLHLPMKLSPRARDQGWTGLVLGPREAITAAELEPYLQETFFDGESAWRLLLQPVFWGAAVVLFLLAGWIMLRERLRHEERHGRRTKGPELLSASRSTYRAKAHGIRFRLRFENPLLGRLSFGPGYRIPRKLESSHILLMGDTGRGKSSAIRQLLTGRKLIRVVTRRLYCFRR